jgi:hypothetical protein
VATNRLTLLGKYLFNMGRGRAEEAALQLKEQVLSFMAVMIFILSGFSDSHTCRFSVTFTAQILWDSLHEAK